MNRLVLIACLVVGTVLFTEGMKTLSKSKIEKCDKTSEDSKNLNCSNMIVLNLAVPSESSGGEASIEAKLVEVENSSSNGMQVLKDPPVITVKKSEAFAVYDLSYIMDVPYKPVEYSVPTHKCEPDAGHEIVKECERLRGPDGKVLVMTQPICCPCGKHRRMRSSCENICTVTKPFKGKPNTAHCLRFHGGWFHVFDIGQRSIAFDVRVELKTQSGVSEVIISPQNRAATTDDNFLKVELVGDFAGYTDLPSFDNRYLIIPREAAAALGQPVSMGGNYSMWMMLEKVIFTLDGKECDKIGVGYEAFNNQPNFCNEPFKSCLKQQIWNYREIDENLIKEHKLPQYGLEGRYERINQHPNAGPYSLSIGIKETLNTDLMIQLNADDIKYVVHRSSGEITEMTVPIFEALTEFGEARVKIKNTGEIEASYGLAMNCSKGIASVQEHFVIIKPKESTTRIFKLHSTNDQAAEHICIAILKNAQYSELDRAECHFNTTATILHNVTQITTNPPQIPKPRPGFFETIVVWWNGLVDFVTGETCRAKCTSFFDISCHIEYLCLTWLVMFGLFLTLTPGACWLMHQKGLFDHIYDYFDPNHRYHHPLLPTRQNAENHHPHRHHRHHQVLHGVKTHKHHREHRHRHKHHLVNQDEYDMLEFVNKESHRNHHLHGRVHKDWKKKHDKRSKHVKHVPHHALVDRLYESA